MKKSTLTKSTLGELPDGKKFKLSKYSKVEYKVITKDELRKKSRERSFNRGLLLIHCLSLA